MTFRFSPFGLVLVTVGMLASPLVAQPPPDVPPSSFRWFLPRVAYRFDEADAVGRQGGLSTLDIFLPLAESPSRDELAFRDVRFLYYHDQNWFAANVGGGYRRYLPSHDITLGGYGYYDFHRMGGQDIHQAVGGVECLGDLVDARANFYIPFGDKRQSLRSTFTPNADALFQGNNLLVGGGLTRQVFQQALTGFDAEVGIRLYASPALEVRSFAGGYYYDGEGSAGAVGPRFRLEGRIFDYATAEASFQHDRVFKTTVGVAMTVSFPRLSGRRHVEDPAQPLNPSDRLGDPVLRTGHVALERQTKITTTPRQAAIDPLTGQPLFFLHVTPGGAGNGTIESPFGALAQAVGDPRFAAGNLVVYDRSGGVFAGNVTFAPGTRLLSNSPIQMLQTTNFGVVTLPFSGADTNLAALPTINGTVRLANDSTLSGYAVNPLAGNDAVTGPSAKLFSNVQVDNNIITGGQRGVGFDDVGGTVVVRDNRITGSGTSAISVGVQSASSATLDLSNNRIASPTQNGIEVLVNTLSGTNASVTANLAGNTITGAGNNGIAIQNDASSSLMATLTGNSANLSGASGLALFSTNGTNTARITATNNTFTNSTNPDVLADYSLGSSTTVKLGFDGNIATPTGYQFNQAGGTTFNVINLGTFPARNTGTLTTTGTINDVPQ